MAKSVLQHFVDSLFTFFFSTTHNSIIHHINEWNEKTFHEHTVSIFIFSIPRCREFLS